LDVASIRPTHLRAPDPPVDRRMHHRSSQVVAGPSATGRDPGSNLPEEASPDNLSRAAHRTPLDHGRHDPPQPRRIPSIAPTTRLRPSCRGFRRRKIGAETTRMGSPIAGVSTQAVDRSRLASSKSRLGSFCEFLIPPLPTGDPRGRNGFVCSIFPLRRHAADCHYGSVGFVCAVSPPGMIGPGPRVAPGWLGSGCSSRSPAGTLPLRSRDRQVHANSYERYDTTMLAALTPTIIWRCVVLRGRSPRLFRPPHCQRAFDWDRPDK
jgi:hypothetical protein